MGKFLFVLTRGLEDPTRVTRTFQLTKATKETGNGVNIFLTFVKISDRQVWYYFENLHIHSAYFLIFTIH